ncbi:HD domain-containing protein [Anaerosporobacter sp.]
MPQQSSKENPLFNEITKHLLEDEKPSLYLNGLLQDSRFSQYPFKMLYDLKGTKQSPEHHPEGDAWNHTLLVVDTAAKLKELSKNPLIFMWAALLHDIGKPRTTKIRKGKITSYDHDKVGEKLAIEFLESLVDDHEFIDEVTNLVRYHMHILFVIRNLPYADRKGLLKKTDVREVALLGYCDRMGRTNQDKRQVRKDIEQFYHIMTK